MQNTATTTEFEAAFADLLQNWNAHQELRTACAPIDALAHSSHSLFRQRVRTAVATRH